MEKKVLAKRLVEIASDLTVAVEKARAAAVLDRLPGFSPMQLRQQIDRIVEIREQAAAIRAQYADVLKKLDGLESEEKKGVEKLKEAAANVKQKERNLVEAEKGLLEFTAFLQEKRPGIEQMIADPTDEKWGEKAGDFFGRIGAKLGDKIQKAVDQIYRQTSEDLTHSADAIRGLKIVAKTTQTASDKLVKAGLADAIISIKDWLAGKAPDSLIGRIINFGGDIKRWVRGFVERTALVKDATKELNDALSDAQAELKKVLA